MATSHDVLQNLRNRIDTAETGWATFAEVATQAYDQALNTHTDALKNAGDLVKLQSDQLWAVVNVMLSGLIGPWVPRLMLPVEKAGSVAHKYISGKVFWVDDLTAAWTSEAMSELRPVIKDKIKDTGIGLMTAKGGSTSDPFKPVVDNTLNYASRLKEGINRRAYLLKLAMDELIEMSDLFSVEIAQAMSDAFKVRCAFLTDLPADTGSGFRSLFTQQAEITMWVAWAVQRDEQYWRWHQYRSGFFGNNWHAQDERRAMQPILDRLIKLGVPQDQVSTIEGHYAGGHSSRFLDMIKLIEWGKRSPPPSGWKASASRAVCSHVNTDWLRLRKSANSSSF